jgi:hypothetical protein
MNYEERIYVTFVAFDGQQALDVLDRKHIGLIIKSSFIKVMAEK